MIEPVVAVDVESGGGSEGEKRSQGKPNGRSARFVRTLSASLSSSCPGLHVIVPKRTYITARVHFCSLFVARDSINWAETISTLSWTVPRVDRLR